MAEQDLKLCPACETRNKVTWEFCVKCGESLGEVAAINIRVDFTNKIG